MTRDELLEKLHSITLHAILTAWANGQGLEVTIFTGEGISGCWIGYDDWNVYELRGVDTKRWRQIRSKISQGNLDKSDIEGTDFIKIVDTDQSDIDYNVLLDVLKDLPTELPKIIYCINDSDSPKFFHDEHSLALFLKDYYSDVSVWEEMDTDELEYWYSQYENRDEFPYYRFDD